MEITVLINAYWPERKENVIQSVKQIREGSVRPDEIIIFNNNSVLELNINEPNVTVIRSGRNFGYRAAYITSLLTGRPGYFLVIDDDCTLGKFALENFMEYAEPGIVLGHWGGNAGEGENPYTENSGKFRADLVIDPTRVDFLVGRGLLFFDFFSIVKMLKVEERLLEIGYDASRDQDLLLSMSNESYVIPAGEGERTVDLGEKGVGYNFGKDHYIARNYLTEILQKITPEIGGSTKRP